MIKFTPIFRNPAHAELDEFFQRTTTPLSALACFGPSASSSQSSSNTTNNNTQTSVQGASGNQSPTITAGKNVSYNDPTLQLSTVQSLTDIVGKVLSGTAGVAQQAQQQVNDVLQNQSNAQQQDNGLLSELLAANSQLTTYQGSNGAIQQSTSTNYMIWGLIILGAVLVLSMFNKK